MKPFKVRQLSDVHSYHVCRSSRCTLNSERVLSPSEKGTPIGHSKVGGSGGVWLGILDFLMRNWW
ncbi:Uncharacterised protein [Mycobacterium tuberculosis]|uniref:Uncharacterized protein n=1 Tax=Mycobacterium tuberculosis TaxID=1773 RepID=A0A0U0RM42_MYCTX|nr:Uncharacterised protein [Mycobacterium tuberculosis]CFS29131.1 Uncharacterised protein [Mycobacterium tuberculosis]CKO44491.1 Uncharacterised protein [Mycobacterium tuberculosis]CKP13850.1 Uncharacterised protein [Mycobacterium tuberculosis]CKR42718.1 Uncharacterised protein [Mycobacterium tuberculosis]